MSGVIRFACGFALPSIERKIHDLSKNGYRATAARILATAGALLVFIWPELALANRHELSCPTSQTYILCKDGNNCTADPQDVLAFSGLTAGTVISLSVSHPGGVNNVSPIEVQFKGQGNGDPSPDAVSVATTAGPQNSSYTVKDSDGTKVQIKVGIAPTTVIPQPNGYAQVQYTVQCEAPPEPPCNGGNGGNGGSHGVCPQSEKANERFLHHRLTALLDDEPDRPRLLRRFPGALWGSGPGSNGSPFNFTASETGERIAFSTSLSQVMGANASADLAKQQTAMGLGSAAVYERPGPAPYQGVDLWTEGHFTSYSDDGGNANANGDLDILYVGADYPITESILIGVLGQFDWAHETTKADGSKVEGEGWMAGPYLSARLAESLFFDWRAAWGTSDNSTSPFGTYSDDWDSDRWLTTARLTGNWISNAWRLTPSAMFKYGEDRQDEYISENGLRVRGQKARLGRVEFGPEIAYRWLLSNGAVIEPQVALYGIWNFENETLAVNNVFFTPDDFTGRLEGGAQVYLPKGWSFRGTAAYDGIGADYEAVTGKVWLNVPLN